MSVANEAGGPESIPPQPQYPADNWTQNARLVAAEVVSNMLGTAVIFENDGHYEQAKRLHECAFMVSDMGLFGAPENGRRIIESMLAIGRIVAIGKSMNIRPVDTEKSECCGNESCCDKQAEDGAIPTSGNEDARA